MELLMSNACPVRDMHEGLMREVELNLVSTCMKLNHKYLAGLRACSFGGR